MDDNDRAAAIVGASIQASIRMLAQKYLRAGERARQPIDFQNAFKQAFSEIEGALGQMDSERRSGAQSGVAQFYREEAERLKPRKKSPNEDIRTK
jgi:hypothetical protein